MELTHQYIDRTSGRVCDEPLFGDKIVRWLYHPFRENAPGLFRLLTGPRTSQVLGLLNYDLALSTRVCGNTRFLREVGGDMGECLDPPHMLNTARKVFERKIRYWSCRPMPLEDAAIVSPADARVLIGTLGRHQQFEIKGKFFSIDELLGTDSPWLDTFRRGDFAIFRLTPDKYHYNHLPVSGEIADIYDVDGVFHSCNPQAIVTEVTPLSKNRRVVTIIDTDVPGGSQVGKVAMLEIVALMIGDIVQAYSSERYDNPQGVKKGMFVEKGVPKSLYRPGSSTDVVLFEPERIRFAEDLLQNQQRRDVNSRFCFGFQQPLVETDIQVRSVLAWPQLFIKEERHA